MEAYYVQFEMPEDSSTIPPNGIAKKIFKSIFVSFLKRIIPQANPDFDEKIDDVRVWLLECDSEGIPTREVGVDFNDQVIVKMPNNNNYGYWTDNSLTLKDFKERFRAKEITRDFFEQKWELLP